VASAPTPIVTAKPRILSVEDDAEIGGMLFDVLAENGFEPCSARSAAEMDALLKSRSVDLVILDIMLPGEDGLSICRRLRAASSIPIIMVTARDEDIDRIIGLEIGADDYVTKPFNSRELIAVSAPCFGARRDLLLRLGCVHSLSALPDGESIRHTRTV